MKTSSSETTTLMRGATLVAWTLCGQRRRRGPVLSTDVAWKQQDWLKASGVGRGEDVTDAPVDADEAGRNARAVQVPVDADGRGKLLDEGRKGGGHSARVQRREVGRHHLQQLGLASKQPPGLLQRTLQPGRLAQ